MLKKVLFLTLVFAATTTFAQDSRIEVRDTPAMEKAAKEYMNVMDETVDLTSEQEDVVYEIYMDIERQKDQMIQRYKDAPEDYEADIKHQRVAWKNHVNTQLQSVLTPEQMTKWVEALK